MNTPSVPMQTYLRDDELPFHGLGPITPTYDSRPAYHSRHHRDQRQSFSSGCGSESHTSYRDSRTSDSVRRSSGASTDRTSILPAEGPTIFFLGPLPNIPAARPDLFQDQRHDTFADDLRCVLGCPVRYRADDVDGWIEHSTRHFTEYGVDTPPKSMCIFCDRYTAKPFSDWNARMSHIHNHLADGTAWSLRRSDFLVVKYMMANELLNAGETKEGIMALSERSPLPGLVSPGLRTEGLRM